MYFLLYTYTLQLCLGLYLLLPTLRLAFVVLANTMLWNILQQWTTQLNALLVPFQSPRT